VTRCDQLYFFTEEIAGIESYLDYSHLHLASTGDDRSGKPDFKGKMQQFSFNGVDYIEKVCKEGM